MHTFILQNKKRKCLFFAEISIQSSHLKPFWKLCLNIGRNFCTVLYN